MNEEKTHIIICHCGDCEHQTILQYYPDDDGLDVLTLNTHLKGWEGFFRRLWHGLRYAFGYKSRYGAWDEIIIDKDEAVRIHEFLADIGYLTKDTINVESWTTNDVQLKLNTYGNK